MVELYIIYTKKGEFTMFKVQEMRELIRLIDKSSISKFTYEKDDSKITIKKDASGTVADAPVQAEAPVAAPAVQKAEIQAPAPKVEAPTAQAEAATESTEGLEGVEEILSPMVGTFYRKPSPESDSYVEVGSKVSEDTIVCIVEAMKLFNEIEAELEGEVVEILVEDGDLVEYGQPLFRVKTN